MATICLVSCVDAKRPTSAPASNLYVSAWFLKAREFAQNRSQAWYILSAKYGLVRPDDVIEPYEQTLNRMSRAERLRWATLVFSNLKRLICAADQVTILAGQRYREFLVPFLRGTCIQVSVPMEGLTIGRQLQWLDRHMASNQAAS